MKRKARKQLSKEGEDEGGSTKVASLCTEIDPDGDLQMDFADSTKENPGQLRGLLVSKHTLRLSSPVFRTMLADDSPFHESGNKTTNKDGIQVIYFEDDDVASMEILMNAIHLQHHKVPMNLTIKQLERLAVVCDKYDIRCLGPWAEMWSKPHVDNCYRAHGRQLFIATVFRLADWFVGLTENLILDTTLSSEGELLLDDSSRFREGVPQSVLDRIAKRRMEVVSELLELCWQYSVKLRSEHGNCTQHRRAERERYTCDLINLGSLSLQFPHLSGSSLDGVDLSSQSARSVISSIRTLSGMSGITTLDERFIIDHGSCSIVTNVTIPANGIIGSVEGIELEAVSSGAAPQKSTLISQLSSLLERFQIMHNTAAFEVVMRYTAIPNDPEFWREVILPSQTTSDSRFAWCPKLKCKHCPGFEYSPFRHQNAESLIWAALKSHVARPLHCERARRRI